MGLRSLVARKVSTRTVGLSVSAVLVAFGAAYWYVAATYNPRFSRFRSVAYSCIREHHRTGAEWPVSEAEIQPCLARTSVFRDFRQVGLRRVAVDPGGHSARYETILDGHRRELTIKH